MWDIEEESVTSSLSLGKLEEESVTCYFILGKVEEKSVTCYLILSNVQIYSFFLLKLPYLVNRF